MKPDRNAPSPQPSAEQTRAALIRAALRLFGSQGFDGTSTREIAAAAKANIGSIAYHFGGKEGLRTACADYHRRDDPGGRRPGARTDARQRPRTPAAAPARLQPGARAHGRASSSRGPEAGEIVQFVLRELPHPTRGARHASTTACSSRPTGGSARSGRQATGEDAESDRTKITVFTHDRPGRLFPHRPRGGDAAHGLAGHRPEGGRGRDRASSKDNLAAILAAPERRQSHELPLLDPAVASLFSGLRRPPPLAVGYVEGEYVLLAPIEVAEVADRSRCGAATASRPGERGRRRWKASDDDDRRGAGRSSAGAGRGAARRPEDRQAAGGDRRAGGDGARRRRRRTRRRERVLARRRRSAGARASPRRPSTTRRRRRSTWPTPWSARRKANLAVAKLPARPETIKAAENQVKQAQGRARAGAAGGCRKRTIAAPSRRPHRRRHPQPRRYRRPVRAGHLDAARRRGEAEALSCPNRRSPR